MLEINERKGLTQLATTLTTQLAAIIKILVDKGVCTEEEMDRAVARVGALVDQVWAEKGIRNEG